ncbi:RTP1/Tango6 family protein [Aspergillus clavatus NRRL 1]|uniref:Protein required for cell viability, putative n=1 Tax=Aspergillus clavatus (strain ATCC 1007 / CBS 513.65 / DSM 816 / NCTC 3887 / NRRL 1 / QM 1276 / 107) TaxID=344612 RepID=A1CTT5_ASPCL|nr:protein required for cell viability, putative [Aspergillus clavatus NRRL 1]EAW06722.1 protein required for cell viability, putative [Aspergillus clavatus NRRL 1]
MKTPCAVLLPILSNFLQSKPAPWFQTLISSQLSRVPLRDDGVLQTIFFLASQFAPSLGQESQAQLSNGPHFTVQGIMQISRLLSSVPEGMDPQLYFTTIAPQLLTLLDGEDPDLKKTVAYVIGNGILGKRAYGAPGAIGHSIFVEPIFKTLGAELDASTKKWMNITSGLGEAFGDGEIVHESALLLAIDRLSSITVQHPNPGLVKRLVYPILLPLWGLTCFALDQQKSMIHEKFMTILQTYFGISVGVQPLKKLVDNLLWDGGATWTYDLDPAKRVVLRKRQVDEADRLNIVRLVDELQSRVKLFITLLGADPNGEERTGDIFLYVSQRWLVQPAKEHSLDALHPFTEAEESSNIIQKLVSAKLAEALLDHFKDTLSRRPLRVLELIKQVVEGELNRMKVGQKTRTQGSGGVSLSSLTNIVPTENDRQEQATADTEAAESLPAVFSLLSTVLASPDFPVTLETLPILKELKSVLDELIPSLPPSLAKPGTTASMLLEIQMTSPEEHSKAKSSVEASDFDTHRRALANLNSDLPPVQAEGFALLSDLVKKSSPVLDIPSTLTLLLSVITDPSESTANDEFIYLNAIKLIGTLASRHPRTVIKTLVDRYVDRTETASLDQRLKIGESLLRTIQDLGQAFTGETAKILGDGMIAVAGRRARRTQAHKRRRDELEKEKRRREREERQNKEPAMPPGWKITTGHTTPQLMEIDEEGSDTESPEQAAHSANILAAWAAGAASDEEPDDLRVRASALSILATAVQTNIAGLGPSIVSSAVGLALDTLSLEPGPECAILRRASVVLLLDILKAVEAARESRGSQGLGFGFSLSGESAWGQLAGENRGTATIGNIPHMLRTLTFVESQETDTIVRGHIRVLIESLEAWLEKSLLWGIGAQGADAETIEPRLDLGDHIAGLTVNPLAGQKDIVGPRIEEIE